MKNSQRAVLFLLLIIVVIAVIGGGVYLYQNKKCGTSDLVILGDKKESVENRSESLNILMQNPTPDILTAVNIIALDKTDNYFMRVEALRALADDKSGTYLKTLEKVSSDVGEDKNLRAVAILQIGKLSGTEAISVLKSLLSDEDRLIQFKVVQALGTMNDSDANDVLLSLAQNISVDTQVRARSITSIGEINVGNCQISDTLSNLLKNEKDDFLKISYMTALGTVGCDNAIGVLSQFASGTNELLKLNAKESIDAINLRNK